MAKKVWKPINDLNRTVFKGDSSFKSLDSRTQKYIKELLFIAWTDFASSNILYKRKLYPQAIYFLQQSVEKITKAEGLREGTFKLDELKQKIGHDTYLIFSYGIKRYKEELNDILSTLKCGVS